MRDIRQYPPVRLQNDLQIIRIHTINHSDFTYTSKIVLKYFRYSCRHLIHFWKRMSTKFVFQIELPDQSNFIFFDISQLWTKTKILNKFQFRLLRYFTSENEPVRTICFEINFKNKTPEVLYFWKQKSTNYVFQFRHDTTQNRTWFNKILRIEPKH